MNFVSEQVIEEAMAAFELSEKTEKTVKKTFQENQQMLYTYLFSDSFSFLKDGEKEIFLYLALLVYKSFNTVNPDLEAIAEATIGQYEERNWEKWNEAKGKTVTDKLDTFFLNYPQEDLLALIEDSLIDEEEEDNYFNFTKEGKEIHIFASRPAWVRIYTSQGEIIDEEILDFSQTMKVPSNIKSFGLVSGEVVY